MNINDLRHLKDGSGHRYGLAVRITMHYHAIDPNLSIKDFFQKVVELRSKKLAVVYFDNQGEFISAVSQYIEKFGLESCIYEYSEPGKRPRLAICCESLLGWVRLTRPEEDVAMVPPWSQEI